MFSVADREALRTRLITYAESDSHIVAAALVGSAARDAEDRWSDIDLALSLAPGGEVDEVADRWTRRVAAEQTVVDTLDVHASGALYRVFLLDSTLQLDLSFFPHDAFRATNGEPFRLVFGDALTPTPTRASDWHQPVRSGWLHLLHARSALARNRLWQAELMLSEVRATVLSLAARRHGLRTDHGREAHRIPTELTEALAEARAAHLDHSELRRSLSATAECLLHEVEHHDPAYAAQLAPTVREIACGS